MGRPRKRNPVSEYLSKIGQKGGKAGTGKAKARTPEQASAAAKARWKKKREAEGGDAA